MEKQQILDTGLISIDSLRKHIEDQMTKEGKQRPIYYIAEASNIENIKIAVSRTTFEAKLKNLINKAEELVAKSDADNNLVKYIVRYMMQQEK